MLFTLVILIGGIFSLHLFKLPLVILIGGILTPPFSMVCKPKGFCMHINGYLKKGYEVCFNHDGFDVHLTKHN